MFNTQIFDGAKRGEGTANFRGNQGCPTSDLSHRPTYFLAVLLRVDWGGCGSLVNNVCGKTNRHLLDNTALSQHKTWTPQKPLSENGENNFQRA